MVNGLDLIHILSGRLVLFISTTLLFYDVCIQCSVNIHCDCVHSSLQFAIVKITYFYNYENFQILISIINSNII